MMVAWRDGYAEERDQQTRVKVVIGKIWLGG